DGRLRDLGRTQRTSDPGTVDPQGRPVAVSSHHDDDDGGHAWRRAADAGYGYRIGDPPAAWLRDGRRAARQPGAYAVHDARRLSLSRQAFECLFELGTLEGRRRPRGRTRPRQGSGRVT